MTNYEQVKVDLLVSATEALANAGYPGPAIERAKYSKVMQDEADAIFALQILNDPNAKGTDVGLMMELAQRKFWRIRKPDSERLANMEGATLARLLERSEGRPKDENGLSALELATASFLLSGTVQALKN